MAIGVKSGSSPTVGIDIGSSLIKVVEARPTKGEVQITALGIAPTPAGTIENEIITDPQTLGQAIRQLLAESGITVKKSVSSVSGQSSVIVRIIEVPKMTKQELAETMKWEVERHVPFAANEVVMDFQPIERPNANPDDQTMEVLLAVAQQELIDSHVETLLAAGLEPIAIDVEPLAMARVFIDVVNNGFKDKAVAIVNIGASTTELAIYQDGLLAFPRTLPIAGDTITRALSDGLHIPLEQAERLKREKAVVLLDRASQLSQTTGFVPVEPGVGQTEPTVGPDFGVETDQSLDSDLGFIPGLGFGPSFDEQKSETIPDFDLDLGETIPQPTSAPIMDFDLSGEDFTTTSVPGGDLVTGEETPVPASNVMSASESDSSISADFSVETIFDTMYPVLQDLIAEIRRSLDYYASRFTGK
jgi:type IV pilus assembly protein PilM